MKRKTRYKNPENWRDRKQIHVSPRKIRAQQPRTMIEKEVKEPVAMVNELKWDIKKSVNRKTGKIELEITISSVGKPPNQVFRGRNARKEYYEKFKRHLLAAGDDYQSAVIYINSQGGSIDSAYGMVCALHDVLIAKINVTVLITGTCGSAATMILGCGWPVYIRPTARVYIHCGRRTKYRKTGGEWEEVGRRPGSRWNRAVLRDVYVRRIRKWSKKKISRKQVKDWMNEGKWFSAEEAVEVGLCDGIWKF